jgi:16S rRNA processing protein RimM
MLPALSSEFFFFENTLSSKREFVVVARIVRPQGRRGEVLADILTDFPEKFAERRQLWVGPDDGNPDPREYNLEDHWFHKGRIVFKFAGIDSIEDAEALSGSLVQIPVDLRAELELNSFYVSDLVGSEVIDVFGDEQRLIGKIEDVQQNVGAAPMLLVRNGDQRYDIPLAQEYLAGFDAKARTLSMKLPSGLLEVNAPLSSDEKKQHKPIG